MSNIILVGVLGKDPDTKTFPNGDSLTQFSIATNDSWTDKFTGSVKSKLSGNESCFIIVLVKLHNSICANVLKFMLKVHCALDSGQTKVVKSVTRLKLVESICLIIIRTEIKAVTIKNKQKLYFI